MTEKKIYQCDYCTKKIMNKYQMKKHELSCWYNPENKSCGSCAYNNYGNCYKGLKKKGELPLLKCDNWFDIEF